LSRPPVRFDEFRRRAEELLNQPGRVQRLAQQATRKLTSAGGDKFRELRDQLKLAIAMVSAWVAGDYREVSHKTIAILVAALLYFVVPMDVIPDFLFGWGFLDDAAVLGYVFSQLSGEVDAFRTWREQHESIAGENDDGP